MRAPTAQRPTNGRRNMQPSSEEAPSQVAMVPFCRASRRKSGQGYQDSYVLSSGGVVTARPIEIPASGFLRYLELIVDLNVTGNTAVVAAPGGTLNFPWNVINTIAVTNAAGDSLFIPVSGYELYLINKYDGTRQSPACDPYNDPQFEAVTTGAVGGGGSLQFRLRVPFELDPRDAFCALPNMASNKSYQVIIIWSALSTIFAGGTAPNGAATVTLIIDQHYWSQPVAVNGQVAQQQEPDGNGSVSLYRRQNQTVSAGGQTVKLTNVGNVIRWGAFMLQSSAANNPRTDADWPAIAWIRLNNDQMFLKRLGNWEAEMRERYGYGTAAVTKDAAGFLDTGVFVWSDLMAQHEHVTPDGPRDQYLVTVDGTLLQFEPNLFGATAQSFTFLTNEIKPNSAAAMYALNVV